jgi:hypothetical protein
MAGISDFFKELIEICSGTSDHAYGPLAGRRRVSAAEIDAAVTSAMPTVCCR